MNYQQEMTKQKNDTKFNLVSKTFSKCFKRTSEYLNLSRKTLSNKI